MWYLCVAGAIVPAVLLAVAWFFSWAITPGGANPTVADIWSSIGLLMGYWSLLFSGYAAYQVRALSEKYFARTRFPQIKEHIDAITKDMAKAADRSASAIRSEKFISSISVSLGEVERVSGHRMSELIKRARSERKMLIEWINHDLNRDKAANQEANYWSLFRTLQEISQGISAYIKEQGAR